MEIRQIALRADTAANWSAEDPVLLAAELGVESDTGRLKIGDGASAWSALGYARVDLSVSRDGTTVTIAASGDDALLPAATPDLAGVMSAADKAKLDGIITLGDVESGADNVFTGANAFQNSSGQAFSSDSPLEDGVVIAGRAGGVDGYRVTLRPAALDGNHELTLPATTGAVVTTGDSGTVTGAMIANGAITNEDVNAAAAIADTKLATISSANKVAASAVDLDGAADIGGALADADLILVDDGGAGVNRKAAITRVTDYTFGKVTGDVTISSSGSAAISAGAVVNADVNAAAAIDHSKLAAISAGQVLMGNGSNVPTATALSGDVTISSGGVTAISSGVIVDADVNASAGIADTKLATISTAGKVSNSATTATSANTASAIVARDGSGNFTAGTITAALSGNASTATNLSSNRTFALTGDVTGSVSSNLSSGASIAASIAAGVIVDADVNASAAIAGTKVSPNFGSQAVATTGTVTGASLIPTSASVPANGVFLPAANTVGLASASTERLRITSTGAVLLGSASAIGDAYSPSGVRLLTLAGSSASFGTHRNDNSAFSNAFIFTKARGTALETVQSGDALGILTFQAANGSAFARSGGIECYVDGTPSSTSMPGRLSFYTTPSGSNTPVERLRIANDGTITIPSGTLSAELSGNASTATSATTATNLAGGSNGAIPYQTASGSTSMLSAGTSGYFLKANGSAAPSWAQLEMTDLPGATFKKSVRVATTEALTATFASNVLTNSGTLAALAIDGITLALNDRVLVKDQATAAHNGIYYVTAVGSGSVAWTLTRAADADSSVEIAAATVAVDTGTTNGGDIWTTTFKTSNGINSVAMNWYELVFNTGTWAISTTGNAATASAWQTGRTIALTGDITGTSAAWTGSGNVSFATAIAAGVIVNADINASAAIADTKLATISTAGKVSGTAITSGNISTSGSIATTSTLAVGQSSAATNTDFDLAGTYAQTIVAIAALNIDCSTGNYFTKTISADSTFTVSNVPASRAYSFTLELTHTSGAITWFSGVEWPGGTAPTLTTGKTHLFIFVTDDGGTRWRGASLADYTN